MFAYIRNIVSSISDRIQDILQSDIRPFLFYHLVQYAELGAAGCDGHVRNDGSQDGQQNLPG